MPSPAMTPLTDDPHLLPRPPASTSQETQNLVRSPSGGDSQSPRSQNEDSHQAPPTPGAFTDRPTTPSPVLPVAETSTSNGSTNSIQFVTVIVPLTRLPESVIKSANPHIKLPLTLPQLPSPDFPGSASEPSTFEEVSVHSQPAQPSTSASGNIIHLPVVNDLSHPETATPEAQTKTFGIPTGIVQSESEPAVLVGTSDSSNSTITSINKVIPPIPSQTTSRPSRTTKRPPPKKVSSSQPTRKYKRQYSRLHRPLCVFCGKVFGRKDVFFDDHLRSHIKEVWFECPDCGKEFIKEQTYKDHLNRFCHVRHNKKLHSCPVCNKSFHTKFKLKLHLKIHSSQKKIHRCSLCPGTFQSRQGLRSHEEVTHERKWKKCEECGDFLRDAAGLRDHMKRHRNIRTHTCLFCNKAFINNQELFRHLRFHTREQVRKVTIHSCIFCGKKCEGQDRFYNHLCFHIREKWHSCAYCGNQFTSKQTALQHIRKFHKDR